MSVLSEVLGTGSGRLSDTVSAVKFFGSSMIISGFTGSTFIASAFISSFFSTTVCVGLIDELPPDPPLLPFEDVAIEGVAIGLIMISLFLSPGRFIWLGVAVCSGSG